MDEFDDIPDGLEEVIAYCRKHLDLPDEEFAKIETAAAERAATVDGLAQLDLVSDVWRSIESAVTNGTTLEDFRQDIGTKLYSAWGGDDPARLENVFRTSIQSAYSAGRYVQNNKPEVKATHPYSRFSAVIDGRTSDICEALDGTVLPSDDDFWASHQPPLHYQCRSDVTAMTAEEAAENGIDTEAPAVDPLDGFGEPLATLDPDLSTRPPELAEIYEGGAE